MSNLLKRCRRLCGEETSDIKYLIYERTVWFLEDVTEFADDAELRDCLQVLLNGKDAS